MKRSGSQWFRTLGRGTRRLPLPMRLARGEGERLWKGLERFVNCGDSVSDYQALGRAFPDFWPVDVSHTFDLRKETRAPGDVGAPALGPGKFDFLRQESLNWHGVCYKLFLFYRDVLRDTWSARKPAPWPHGNREKVLLGLDGFIREAWKGVKQFREECPEYQIRPRALHEAWEEILRPFPSASPAGPVELETRWESGDLYLVPQNAFQSAFYRLFQQSWRARVCPRCKMYFVARRPKQTFCGTVCSAGSRLASKRKWWNRVGVKRRAAQSEKRPKGNLKERKRR